MSSPQNPQQSTGTQMYLLGSILLLLQLLATGLTTTNPQSAAQHCASHDHDCRVLYEWNQLDYLWPNDTMRREFLQDGRFNPAHCLLSGVKVYKGDVFVTVPRIRYYKGVPAPVNRVVIDPSDKKAKLEPFPDWESQLPDNDCDNMQMAMSIEIDPVTGYLYVIDPGRPGIVGVPEEGVAQPKECQPKLFIFDINARKRIRTFELPPSIANKSTNFLNDIVLDRGDPTSKTVRWVYITDAIDSILYVIDLQTNETRALQHPSMDYEDKDSVITVNKVKYELKLPIDGLAMTRDFKYVYYCALGSFKLWRVPTFALRDPKYKFGDHVKSVGKKISQTGGMIYGTDNLFYGGLSKNAVYRWNVRDDMKQQGVSERDVKIKSETELVKDDKKLIWPDAFAIDEKGFMYFSACRANEFIKGKLSFSGERGSNFRIWKVNIQELGYLSHGRTVNLGAQNVASCKLVAYLVLLSLPLAVIVYNTGRVAIS